MLTAASESDKTSAGTKRKNELGLVLGLVTKNPTPPFYKKTQRKYNKIEVRHGFVEFKGKVRVTYLDAIVSSSII